eukprot:CAMPEP_0172322562 /NCGR_PEP_ID=MMETSP1058-20130122/46224_1 /TAXON_ID=83371 /ORGANISM="Detonula confervacea, Strain CCMP 353" /LENGTH=550 /DNA_ID=CAMNT_0013038333 /DNA_START=107 /DNA_END=1759 /DNA_ORIENTATION=+
MELESDSSSRRQSSMTEEERDDGSGISNIKQIITNLLRKLKAYSGDGNHDETETTNEAKNCRDNDLSISPIFYYTSIFLIVITLLQIITSLQDQAGPMDWFAEMLIPRIASMGFKAGMDEDEFGTTDGNICPPDRWIDSTFEQGSIKQPNGLYSAAYDPRNKVIEPTHFPHCASSRWVQLEKEHDCPSGREYVTIILPPKSKQSTDNSAGEGKIPKILHLSSPTNCLPTTTIQTLRHLTHQHISQAFTIYVHSSATMDNFLYQREWDIFPEVKEGVMCGMGKLNAVTRAAIKELKVGNNSTEQQHQRIVDEIGLGVKRDIWRYMILWEYGGITIDIDTLHTILAERGTTKTNAANATTDDGGYKTMRKLMHQWSTEKSDALLYFINNADKQRLPYVERIPFTDIMGAAPHHPLVYYSAKTALKNAILDTEKSITDTGRTTKIPPIKDGLHYTTGTVWKQIKTGEVIEIKNEKEKSIHIVDGDVILPPSLTSPKTSPWKSIFAAFKSSNAENMPSEDDINYVMRQHAAEQKYVAPKTMFSCMEHLLDAYLQ